ncbi:MAG TPA: YtxH domain-containing protein [Salinimicrobium sp.]|nr:YtxH domain-containing protein [Salinimicrobium sp.]
MSNSGSTFLALLTGAAIGAGVGLLYAPDRGEETRRKLGDNARRAQENLNKHYKQTSSNLSQKASRAKVDFETRLEETLSSASYKADEILSALETKLEELRKQNAKLQKNKTGTTSSAGNANNLNSTDKAVV